MSGVVASRSGPTAVFMANGVELNLIQRGGGVGKDDVCTLWGSDDLGEAGDEADLQLIQEECREGGEVEALGETWLLAEAAPEEWRDEFPVSGAIIRDGPLAVFEARGVQLDMIQMGGGVGKEDGCTLWRTDGISETGEEG